MYQTKAEKRSYAITLRKMDEIVRKDAERIANCEHERLMSITTLDEEVNGVVVEGDTIIRCRDCRKILGDWR
jgi:hypothetical protein